MMSNRYFYMKDIDCTLVVEYTTRKNMLEWLDEMCKDLTGPAAEMYDYSDDVYMILYKDGTTDYIDEEYDGHHIKKQHIASIVNINSCSAMVYGHFAMNECGVVEPAFEDAIDDSLKEVDSEYYTESAPEQTEEQPTTEQAAAETAKDAEPENTYEHTVETASTKPNNWFKYVFLQSLYSTAGHSEKWLTAKQTAICTQYMDRRTIRIETATGYNNHDNYVYNWDGREVILSYSKKNGCGTIWFGLNAEEQEQAQIENEAEKRQKIIETAQRRLRRSPERYYATLDKMKAKIEHYQQDIEDSKEEGDTDGLENLISYVESLKNELDLWESIYPQTTEQAEPEKKPEEIAVFTVGAEYGKADIKFSVESIKNNHIKIMIDGKNRVMLKRISGGAECVKISGFEISAHDILQSPTEPPTSPTDAPEDDSTENYTTETENPSERQEQPEIIRFEIGKIYGTVHTTNSDYMSCYKCIGRTDKTIILENSSGEKIKKRPSLTEHCIDGQKITCETVFPQGCYSMCLVLDASDIITGAACPSVMISGAGNFPTRKKEKQNARFDTLMKQYNKIKQLLEKIEKPHGYGVEIRRGTITAEEFDSILYFETIINEEENRLQLVFDGKPEEEERNILKKNGFRWSPRFKAWQRQLTENAVAAVWAVVAELDKLEDAENNEIQAETEKIKSATPENERTETVENTVETVESEQATAKSNNIDLSPLPCLNGENIPCFVPDSYIGLYSTAQALAANAANPENEKYFREQISRILKKYIADAENVLAVYGAEAIEIFEYAEIFNSFIYGELSEEISTAKEKGLKIFAEYNTEPEQEETVQHETIPTETDTSPTDSPEQSAPETIRQQAENANLNVFGDITEETDDLNDWSGVKFEPIPGIPDPETVGADTAEHADKLTEALEKLDRMRHKLDKSTYTSTGNNRYYNGFWSAVCCIFGAVLYDTETGKHYLQAASETVAQPEEAKQAEAAENNAETAQTSETEATAEPEQIETIKFEPGKIYSAIHITNSDYISAYRVISRTAKTIILENSSGERFRKRPTITDGYINGKQCRCETVYPDGVYSMCLVLRATDTVDAETPKQAETEYHTAQQTQTAAAVSAARQRQIIQTTGGAKITMTIGAAN